MSPTMQTRPVALITASVWLHAAVTVVHSAAHIGTGVSMPLPAMVYIWSVIIIGPIAGWWLMRSAHAGWGCAIVAACMIGAFVFGALHHFVWPGADHVGSIVAGRWRAPFQASAVLLALTEAFGGTAALLGLRDGFHAGSRR